MRFLQGKKIYGAGAVTRPSAPGTNPAHSAMGDHGPAPRRQWPLRRRQRVGAALQEQTTMKSLWHWLTELDEVYARHAGRHGPNRLLPAEVLPAHGRLPKDAEPSPQDAGPDERMAEPSTPKACTRI